MYIVKKAFPVAKNKLIPLGCSWKNNFQGRSRSSFFLLKSIQDPKEKDMECINHRSHGHWTGLNLLIIIKPSKDGSATKGIGGRRSKL